MLLEDILKLTNAGWTKEDIYKMMNPAPSPEPAPAPTPAPSPEPAPAPTPTPAPSPEPPTAPAVETETNKLLKELIGLTRAGNINQFQQQQQPQKDPAELLAEILNP